MDFRRNFPSTLNSILANLIATWRTSSTENRHLGRLRSQIENYDATSREPRPNKPLAFYMSFIALLIMGFICATVLGVAIPVSCIFRTSFYSYTYVGQGFWASTSFLLAVVIVQPLYTSVSNVMGRMMPLYTSYFFFIVGSIVFAVAQNMTGLIAGRVLGGLGAERPIYLGYFSIPMLGGTVLGPILAGAFSQYVTWRWIGWINLPLSAIGLVLSIFFLRLKAIDQPLQEKLRRLEWGVLVLFTTGCTLFASPVPWAGAMFPWSSYQTLVPSFFPYRIFKGRTASLTLFVSFLHGIANYSITLYIPLFFQAIYLEAPLPAAVLTLPVCFLAIGTAVIAAVVVEVLRRYRLVILISWIFMASFQVVLGIRIGAFWSVLNLPLQASMENVDDMGLAAGILCSFRLFGGLIGLALSSTIFNTIFMDRIKALGPLQGELAVLGDIQEAVGFIPLLRHIETSAKLLDRVIEAYRISIFGFIKEKSLEREELERQHFKENNQELNQ
ncbi:MFS general substrate transporter [Lindgomyces ingoldianus]|uniref:MFS general substrate transporter n=1 Tax=Lindgomyces ingoldianus TaxID=673940 RepID=A0ACB6QA41_9PLEO|nr:MFS general substrate transporter [Lindgomyces ingoldianus]KAF2463772.1 MFS general substrate transporter [Lindgomyces ingoldianus]